MTDETGQELPEGEETLAAEAQAALSEVATPVEPAQRPPFAADAHGTGEQSTQPTPVQSAIPGSMTPQPVAAAPVSPAAAPVTPAYPAVATVATAQGHAEGAPAPATAGAEPMASAHEAVPAALATPASDWTAPAQPIPAAAMSAEVLPPVDAPVERARPATAAPEHAAQPEAVPSATAAPVPAQPIAPTQTPTPTPTPTPAAVAAYAGSRSDEHVADQGGVAGSAPATVAPAGQPAPTTAPAQPATKQNLQDVVNAAGLTWVETDPDRHAQTQQRMAASHTPMRLGRERKAVPPVSSAPLVQVETPPLRRSKAAVQAALETKRAVPSGTALFL